MPKTNDEIAAILDPDKHVLAWWMDIVDIEDRTIYPPCLPDFPSDDAACFRECVPILRALGWTCTISKNWVRWTPQVSAVALLARQGIDGQQKDASFALATCAALAWASKNMPEELRAALGRIANA